MEGMRRRSVLAGAAGVLIAGPANPEVPPAPVRFVKDLIILIPGITGSALSVDGKPLWSPSTQGIVSALLSLGKNLRPLTLRKDDVSGDPLDDGVEATALVEDIHLIPGLWKIDGYTRTIEHLSRLPGVQRGENFHTFAYDWRRDNRASARRLKAQADVWLDAWRVKSGNPEARLVLLAHSMGGLVARYFIECLDGWTTTRSLVTFGTPFRGAPLALRALTHGVSLNEVSQLLRSFTSVYQLLPIYACIEQQGAMRRVGEVQGLPNVDPDRVRHAQMFHAEMNEAATRNRGNVLFQQSGYVCLPVVGVRQETVQLARMSGSTLSYQTEDPGNPLLGDGTVPRPSATPIELEDARADHFLSESHGSLQNADKLLSQVADMLMSSKTEWPRYRSAWSHHPDTAPSLQLSADGVRFGMSPSYGGRADALHFHPWVDIEVAEAYSGRIVHQESLATDDRGRYQGRVPSSSLPVGAYRVRATLSRRTQVAHESLSDVFCVLPS